MSDPLQEILDKVIEDRQLMGADSPNPTHNKVWNDYKNRVIADLPNVLCEMNPQKYKKLNSQQLSDIACYLGEIIFTHPVMPAVIKSTFDFINGTITEEQFREETPKVGEEKSRSSYIGPSLSMYTVSFIGLACFLFLPLIWPMAPAVIAIGLVASAITNIVSYLRLSAADEVYQEEAYAIAHNGSMMRHLAAVVPTETPDFTVQATVISQLQVSEKKPPQLTATATTAQAPTNSQRVAPSSPSIPAARVAATGMFQEKTTASENTHTQNDEDDHRLG